MMKALITGLAATLLTSGAMAADYVVDTQGAHAAINFKIQHLGYSWLTGRFNDFEGKFSYDESAPEASNIVVTIDTASIDSNHEKRDEHLRSDDFLHTDKYPKAEFVSTSIVDKGNGKLEVTGDFTFHGVTRSLTIDATKIGEGADPWGGYRAGFMGTTSFALKDYGIDYDLGPASQVVSLTLHVEGVRQ